MSGLLQPSVMMQLLSKNSEGIFTSHFYIERLNKGTEVRHLGEQTLTVVRVQFWQVQFRR